MGRPSEEKLKNDPFLALLYEEYVCCRLTHFVPWRKPAGRKGEEKVVAVPYPMGFSVLPRAGGVQDQDYVTMKIFKGFLQGDQRGTLRVMNK